MGDDFLEERTRAEDIILGGLGFGEDATLLTIVQTENGFEGTGRWPDGDEFSFECDDEDELSELEKWALQILLSEQISNTTEQCEHRRAKANG